MVNNEEFPNYTAEPLQILAFRVERTRENNLLHQFVLDDIYDGIQYSEEFVNVVLTVINDSAAAVNALNLDGYSPLHLAVLQNKAMMVEKLLLCLKNRINVNTKGKSGQFPLHVAADCGHFEIVKELLKSSGVMLNTKDIHNRTPLDVARTYGHDEIVKELLEAKNRFYLLEKMRNKILNTCKVT